MVLFDLLAKTAEGFQRPIALDLVGQPRWNPALGIPLDLELDTGLAPLERDEHEVALDQLGNITAGTSTGG